MTILRLRILTALCFLLSVSMTAQQNPNLENGFKAFGSYDFTSIDSVGLQNRGLTVRIPLYQYPQRGTLSRNLFAIYNGKMWRVHETCSLINPDSCKSKWLPDNVHNVPGINVVLDGISTAQKVVISGKGLSGQSSAKMTQVDWDGSQRTFATSTSDPLRSGYGTYRAIDGSGSMLSTKCFWCSNIPVDNVSIMKAKSGDILQSGNYLIEDVNGNKMNFDISTNSYVDTIGRIVRLPYNDIPEAGGQGQILRTTTAVPVKTNFKAEDEFGMLVTEYTGTLNLISSIAVSDGGVDWATSPTWRFEYAANADGSNFGDLTKITTPNGGTISYKWATGATCDGFPAAPSATTVSRQVVSRTVNANDGLPDQIWSYSGLTGNPVTMVVTDPMGHDTAHSFSNMPYGDCKYRYETQTAWYDGPQASGALLKTVQTQYRSTHVQLADTTVVGVLPTVITTIYPNGKQSKIEKDYTESDGITGTLPIFDLNGTQFNIPLDNVHEEREYDFQSNGTYKLLRRTHYTYLAATNTTAKNLNILNRVKTAITYDGLGNQVASTTYNYDEFSPLQPSGVSTTYHDTTVGTVRGNPTTVSKWVSGGTYLTTTTKYYDTGMPYQVTDPGGHTTTYSYDPAYQGAYLTQTQMPDTHSPNLAHHAISATYDFNSGLVMSFKSDNQQGTPHQSSYTYDPLGRMLTASFADDGWATFTYPDAVTVRLTKAIDSGKNLLSAVRFDGLGRVIRKGTANDGVGNSWIVSDTCYNGAGSASFKSYPYQLSDFTTSRDCSGAGTPGDLFSYDGAQRQTLLTHSDGSTVISQYTGAAVMTQDEGNGNLRVSKVAQSDGLGRLISVCELSATNSQSNPELRGFGATPVSCGQDIAATGYLTTYGYDALNNLTSVQQGGYSARTFHYDGVSRLTDATNPESGLVSYTYWPDGMVNTRKRPMPNQPATDSAHQLTTTYIFDELHRKRTISYSDGTTPTATFNYDEATVAGQGTVMPTGLMTSQYTGNTGEYYWDFDPVGRARGRSQCVPSPSNTAICGPYYNSTYLYNYLGQETSAQLPLSLSLPKLTTDYDSADRLASVTSTLSDANHPAALLANALYGPFGLTSVTIGSRYNETRSYASRGWLSGVSDATTTGTLIYSSAIPDSGGFAPNGDILSANDSVNGNWAYTYDSFNRVSSAVAANKGWGCAWVYDRFGNRYQQNPYNGSCFPSILTFNSGGDNTNHIDGSGIYDAIGNVTHDPLSGNNYAFDAESRVKSMSSIGYIYDAAGRRVAKTNSGAITAEFLFDNSGAQQIELTGAGAVVHTNIFAGGRLVATYRQSDNMTHFHFSDWLATRRVQADAAGFVEMACSSYPFGDGQTCTGSGSDATEHHFTGKERDIETGLDYFGARYYSANMGRWIIPDWAANPVPVPFAKLENPQSLNLFGYAVNNPVTLSDPDGHDDCTYDQTGKSTCVKRGFWHNLIYGDTYKLQADDGKVFNLIEPLKQLKNGQKYQIVGSKETAAAMGIFVGENARGPNDPPVDRQTARVNSQPGHSWDFKNQFLIPAYGRNALFVIGDTAHFADDIGNMTWGYIMSSYGFSSNLAHAGAGLQSWQTYHKVSWCLQSLCDDPKDYFHIDVGYEWQKQNAAKNAQ